MHACIHVTKQRPFLARHLKTGENVMKRSKIQISTYKNILLSVCVSLFKMCVYVRKDGRDFPLKRPINQMPLQ